MRGERARRGALVVGVVAGGCVGIDQPLVSGVDPAAAPGGAIVIVRGAHFCGPDTDEDDEGCAVGGGDVTFGLDPQVGAAIVAWTDTAIEVVVPTSLAPGPAAVVVTTYGRSSNAAAFEVLP